MTCPTASWSSFTGMPTVPITLDDGAQRAAGAFCGGGHVTTCPRAGGRLRKQARAGVSQARLGGDVR